MYRSRWGKLKTAVLFALIDKPQAKLREIVRYCWDDEPTELRLHSLARAARGIAYKVRREVEGRAWVWRLKPDGQGSPDTRTKATKRENNCSIFQ
jgi:hypothetical protein